MSVSDGHPFNTIVCVSVDVTKDEGLQPKVGAQKAPGLLLGNIATPKMDFNLESTPVVRIFYERIYVEKLRCAFMENLEI